MKYKIHRMSKVSPNREYDTEDSVVRSKLLCHGEKQRAQMLLMEAQGFYDAMYRFRVDRERNKRYNYGDQWGDIVCVDGKTMTEEQYIMKQGNIPLKNNLIRRLVKSVVGTYRNQNKEPTCMARDREEQKDAEVVSSLMQYNMQLNKMNEVYARSLEEFLISGMVVQKTFYGWRNDKEDCWVDYVQPNNFFIDNNMRDFRAWDCSCVGEIHDITFEELTQKYANTKEDYIKLSEIYRTARDKQLFKTYWEDFGYRREQISEDFLTPKDYTRCRVIELWRKESKPRYRCHDYNTGEVYKIELEDYEEMVESINRERIESGLNVGMSEDEIPIIKATWFMDSYWYYYHLSPLGDIIEEGETPYAHKSHPYTFKAYPFIDGEIHSFVSDVIDQQRYTNRLITLYDWIMRSSAKGVLMIPEDSIPKGMSVEQFADAWTRHDGVVVYTPSRSGEVPRQIQVNSTNIGISELLNMQLKFFEDISGIHGALQGKTGYSGTSAALYNLQTQNATTTLVDLLETFSDFVSDSSMKEIKNVLQFYDDKKIISIAGKVGISVRDSNKIRELEFDLSMVQSNSTPIYRAISNDFLMQLWQSQAISLEQLLENGSFPFADKLLQSIQSQKEQLQQGEIPDGVSQETISDAQYQQQAQQMQ